MKKAIITGASNGLGKEIGTFLNNEGISIVNLSRSASNFEDIIVDLANEGELLKAIENIKENHADFDLLILNAGIMPLAPVGKTNFNIHNLFHINVMSAIKIVDALLAIAKQNRADIVFVGSTAAFKGSQDHAVYCSTKHALEGFIKSLQVELKEEPVRVFGFHPGGFNSNLRGGLVKEGYMDPKELAKLCVSLVKLPKSMEVSQIIINRKRV